MSDLKFAAIGINHSHIYGQVECLKLLRVENVIKEFEVVQRNAPVQRTVVPEVQRDRLVRRDAPQDGSASEPRHDGLRGFLFRPSPAGWKDGMCGLSWSCLDVMVLQVHKPR
jgi:hypothetical protein